jgi:hypothetical protein
MAKKAITVFMVDVGLQMPVELGLVVSGLTSLIQSKVGACFSILRQF